MAEYILKVSGSNDVINIIEWNGSGSLIAPDGYTFELLSTSSNFTSSLFTSSTSPIEFYDGRLSGTFSGEIVGSVIINGKTLNEIIHETNYGELTLINVENVGIISQSNSFFVTQSNLKLPLVNVNQYKQDSYYTTLNKIVSESISNYVISFKQKENPNIKIQYLATNTEITSSGTSSYFNITTLPIDSSSYNTVSYEQFLKDYDLYYRNWYVDFDLGYGYTVGQFYGNITGNTGSFKEVMVTGSINLSGSLTINNKTIDSLISNSFRREVKILKGYGVYKIPSWVKEVGVICIGGGGAGGGGVSVSGSHFTIGAGGGSGGCVSYSQFFEPGKYPEKTWVIGYITSPKSEGGAAYYASGSSNTGGYGTPVTKNILEFQTIHDDYWVRRIGGSYGPMRENPESFYGLNFNYTKLARNNVQTFHTGSKGKNGYPSWAWLTTSSSLGYETVVSESLTLSANGGKGGFGGVSIELKYEWFPYTEHDSLISNYNKGFSDRIYLYDGNKNYNVNGWIQEQIYSDGSSMHSKGWIPFVEAVGSLRKPNKEIGKGQFQYDGGPGGFGVTEPYSVQTESRGYVDDEYLQSSINIPQYLVSETSPSKIFIANGEIRHSIDGLNYLGELKPIWSKNIYNSNVGPTGGAGGNGWISGSWNSINYDKIRIGIGGKHLETPKYDSYEWARGGNGGSVTTRNNLSPTLPTSGSGFGAGGGGGASSAPGEQCQSGANGNEGAIILIMVGNSNNPTDFN